MTQDELQKWQQSEAAYRRKNNQANLALCFRAPIKVQLDVDLNLLDYDQRTMVDALHADLQDYVAALDTCPPIRVEQQPDGCRWRVLDGCKRIAAARAAGRTKIRAMYTN